MKIAYVIPINLY